MYGPYELKFCLSGGFHTLPHQVLLVYIPLLGGETLKIQPVQETACTTARLPRKIALPRPGHYGFGFVTRQFSRAQIMQYRGQPGRDRFLYDELKSHLFLIHFSA